MFNNNLSGPCSLGIDSNNLLADTFAGAGSVFGFDCVAVVVVDCFVMVGGFDFFFFLVPVGFAFASNE